MINLKKIRQDFPMLQNKSMQNHPLVYLDNGATTLKPSPVIDAVVDYYKNYGANAHRGDYDLSYRVDQRYSKVREIIANFINADQDEVVFTSGATEGLNTVAYGLGKTLSKGDIILTTEAEHASCILPFMRVAKEHEAEISYIPLHKNGRFDIEYMKSVMNENVKIIVLAMVGNVLGYLAPIKEICKIAHEYGAIVVVDGAQSIPHMKIDVKDLDCDFFAFSAHKMCGPTGVGAFYGKKKLLENMEPMLLGGDSNARFNNQCHIELKDAPEKFESGTQPLEAIFGFGEAVRYLEKIGMDQIYQHEKELYTYAIEKMKQMDNIILYNADADAGIITFNVKGVFAQDVASFFNANGIAVRSGQHCAKLLQNVLGTSATVRASIYFYNTKEDIDYFLKVCENATMEACLDIFF